MTSTGVNKYLYMSLWFSDVHNVAIMPYKRKYLSCFNLVLSICNVMHYYHIHDAIGFIVLGENILQACHRKWQFVTWFSFLACGIRMKDEFVGILRGEKKSLEDI